MSVRNWFAAVAVSVCLVAPPVAAAVSPGVYLYQLTQTGLSATLTVGGAKFFKDGDLN